MRLRNPSQMTCHGGRIGLLLPSIIPIRTERAMADQSALWGSSLEHWDTIGVRLMMVGGALGFLALGVSLASSFVLWKVAGVAQEKLEEKVRPRQVTQAQVEKIRRFL